MYKHLPAETKTKLFFENIYDLLIQLSVEHEIGSVLQKILVHTSDYIGIRNANIYMPAKEKMISVCTVNESTDIELLIPKNESEKLISNYFVLEEESLSLYPSLLELNHSYTRARILSCINYDNNLLGIITYGHKIDDDYQNDDKLLITLISNMIAKIIFYSNNYIDIASKSADEVYLKTIVDSLSGLYIKTYTEQRMIESIKEAIRYKKYDSFCMIKIDKFNELRDEYGQHTVNEIINKAGYAIKSFIRKDVDLAGKYNEDTFLILLPSTQIKGAIVFAEKLRSYLGKVRPDNHPEIEAGFSIAVTSLEPQDRDKETIMNKLLDGISHSFKNGGNKVSYHFEGNLTENLSDFEKAKGLSADLLKNTIQNNYTLVDENGNEIEFNSSFNKNWLNIPKN